jgi:serine/threonine protein kinase
MTGSLIERWHELRPLFERLLEIEPSQRTPYLAAVALSHPDLHADLLRLLARHEDAPALTEPAAGIAAPAPPSTPEARTQALADTPQTNSQTGRRVGPFRLCRQVGIGGMGTVYEAERTSGGFRQRVAIKLIAGLHPGLAERFARERQILADLNHPNIPPLLDGGETEDGMPWFATEFIDGQALTDYADERQLEVGARVELLLRVAAALAYAHRRGVIHRDIKPGNILVTAEGTVKLLDFGIAKLVDDSAGGALTRQAIGPMTPEYAAPEQFRGEPASHATDIYQFGVLAYRLLAGGYPYAARATDPLAFARAVCEQPALALPTPADKDTTLGAEARRQWRALRTLIERCLQKRPQQRWPDMQALINALESARSRASATSGHPATGTWQARPIRSTGRRLLLAAGALALLAIALIWSSERGLWNANPWLDSPALNGLGLSVEQLHPARTDTDEALQRALRAEAQGDLDRALAVLESVHAVDERTPVPAMLLAYWGSTRVEQAQVEQWRSQAGERLEGIDDPYLHLLQRFIEAELEGDAEAAMRYAAALLDARPRAWFLRLARAHWLNARGLRAAALRELQQIDAPALDHRKLVEALADRASMGDLAGARAIADRVLDSAPAPERAMLQARLAYSGGDLEQAQRYFAEAVVRAQDVAQLAIEARALLYLGVIEASRGLYGPAQEHLQQAQQRLAARGQYNFAVDAALAQAQIASVIDQPQRLQQHLQEARALRLRHSGRASDPMIELFAARLGLPFSIEAEQPLEVQALLRARQALVAGEREVAVAAIEDARRLDVASGYWLEEYALLCRALGLEPPSLPPIDPPFQPYSRFAARWALGAGSSIAPPPPPPPPPRRG